MNAIRLALLCSLSATLLHAQAPTLGAAPPALSIGKWLRGQPVESFEAGTVYAVVFWATWCSSCGQHMDLFQRLQDRYGKDKVRVIAVTSPDARNTLGAVEARLKGKGKDWTFTVAWDDAKKTAGAWLVDQKLGPHAAFVVDGEGRLAYLGDPGVLDLPLAGLKAGSWDPAKADGWLRTAGELSKYYDVSREGAPVALAKLEALVEECPGLDPLLTAARFDLMLKAGKYEAGFAFGRQAVEAAIAGKDSSVLNEVAWSIVDPAIPHDRRDLELARVAAEKAVELTEQRDGNLLDTLARVCAWQGDYKKALELQRRAVLFGSTEDLKKSLQEYEAAVKKAEAGGDGK